jgi:hypothetical protein
MANSVEVLSSGQVVVTEVAEQVIEIRTATTPLTVEVATEGPQGPAAFASLSELDDVNVTGRVDKSVLYYDSATSEWKGDDINTVITLTDGGAF